MGNKNSSEDPRKSETGAQSTTRQLQELNLTLEKRLQLLDKRIDEEVKKAKTYMSEERKEQAILCLKKKKGYEEEKKKIQAKMMNNEEMIAKFDEAILNSEVLNAQKQGAKELKKIFKGVNVEDIDQQISDIQDAMADADEISNALAQPLGTTLDDVDDELLALQDEIAHESLQSVTVGSNKLPETGKKAVKKESESEEDEELAKLRMEMEA